MKLAITICATKSYAYAMIAQARRIQACIQLESKETTGKIIIVGDASQEIEEVLKFYDRVLPVGWTIEAIIGKFQDGLKNYKNPAQLVIARMRSQAFDAARKMQADLCWSLDSDVLPPANALRCMKTMLEFDGGYYDISTCPYPSQGGGDFLGGRGTPQRPILPDFYDDERQVPEGLKKRMDAHGEALKKLNGQPDEAWLKARDSISKQVKACPPIGNVFACNARGWRRRGWLSAAYPAIGQGAVLPSDWCGFGCTLMTPRALSMAQFDGYDGGGTEDLFVVWKRWQPAGLKINVITHAPCDHVIRNPKKRGYYILCRSHHETSGEFVGHLRIERRAFYQQSDGEKFDPQNDGGSNSRTAIKQVK